MYKKLNAEKIIGQIESLLGELKNSLLNASGEAVIINLNANPRKKKFSGLTADVYELVEEGFFDTSKTITDLQKKLKDRGINKPTTSLMAPLKHLIVNHILDRTKPDKGIYNYLKR
jgi:hypothetical protein